MDVKELPEHPNAEQYRKEVEDLVRAFKSRDAAAVSQIQRFHPRFRKLSEAQVFITAFSRE